MFATHAPDLRANDWRAIIPLVPGDKRPMPTAWQNYGPEPAGDDQIAQWCNNSPNAGVGLAFAPGAGKPFALDIDRLDTAAADYAIEAAARTLGTTPLIRIGQAPKAMLFYQQAEPIQSRKLHHHGIEIFASSGQVVLYAVHPKTKRPYEWPDGDPRTVPVHDLPKVTEAALQAFLRLLGLSGDPHTVSASTAARTAYSGSTAGSGDLAACAAYHRANPGPTFKRVAEFILNSDLRHPAMVGAVAYCAQAGHTLSDIRENLLSAYLEATADDCPHFRAQNFEDALRWARQQHIAIDVPALDRLTNRQAWGRFAT